MFATVKQIFSPKNKDLQKRIAFTFFVLFIFMLGTTVVVPVIDKENLLGNIKGFDLFNINIYKNIKCKAYFLYQFGIVILSHPSNILSVAFALDVFQRDKSQLNCLQ